MLFVDGKVSSLRFFLPSSRIRTNYSMSSIILKELEEFVTKILDFLISFPANPSFCRRKFKFIGGKDLLKQFHGSNFAKSLLNKWMNIERKYDGDNSMLTFSVFIERISDDNIDNTRKERRGREKRREREKMESHWTNKIKKKKKSASL